MEYRKQYGIFYLKEDRTLMGYVEMSYQLQWATDYVRSWDKKGAMFQLKTSKQLYPETNPFILRLTRKNLPYGLKIDWAQYNENNRISRKSWVLRNVPFDIEADS